MKRLTLKFLIGTVFIMFLSSFIPNLLWSVFGSVKTPSEVTPRLLLLGRVITVTLTIGMYSVMIDQIILRRLSKLNRATFEVSRGNYDYPLDVSQDDEINDLAENFSKMQEGLKSNEYLNKEFVRNFSHELKTPLSAIKGYSELISTSTLTEEEIKNYSRIISQEADRLSKLSKNMLQISLVDSQSVLHKNDSFNVSEQIRNVIQLMQLDWEEKDIELNLELSDIVIKSNKEFTYQVWTNLISNAIKFSPTSSTIDIELKEENEFVKFIVKNQGGIPLDDQEKIFDLFFVSEASRTQKSNGVGLTLTKKIVTKLDGQIDFSSSDENTVFIVKLPK